MGDVIKPEPPQWEGQEELQAWRKHRERQSLSWVFDPATKTYRPQSVEKKPVESGLDSHLARTNDACAIRSHWAAHPANRGSWLFRASSFRRSPRATHRML